jgi:glycosyltransferase involved in cell wall biosynthesis
MNGKGDRNRTTDFVSYRKNYPVRLSIVIAVLDSHEVVQYQIRHFEKFIWRYSVELIIMDDGSELPLDEVVTIDNKEQIGIVKTYDTRQWSQPVARNYGAKIARGEYILFTDIDHIITEEALKDSIGFTSDKLVFRRSYGVLTPDGNVSCDKETLLLYGCKEKDLTVKSQHANTFCIKKTIFLDMLNGYDEKFCGKYGGDDTDLNNRYGNLYNLGMVERHKVAPAMIYVYPDPRRDVKKIFHSLRSK